MRGGHTSRMSSRPGGGYLGAWALLEQGDEGTAGPRWAQVSSNLKWCSIYSMWALAALLVCSVWGSESKPRGVVTEVSWASCPFSSFLHVSDPVSWCQPCDPRTAASSSPDIATTRATLLLWRGGAQKTVLVLVGLVQICVFWNDEIWLRQAAEQSNTMVFNSWNSSFSVKLNQNSSG